MKLSVIKNNSKFHYPKVGEPGSLITTKISHFKHEIKKLLISKQNEGDKIEWQKSISILY